MTLARTRSPSLPPHLNGWTVVDDHGLPRYSATVWQALHGGSMEMDPALQNMRVFFGWTRDSEMPLSVWQKFDDRAEVLRAIHAVERNPEAIRREEP